MKIVSETLYEVITYGLRHRVQARTTQAIRQHYVFQSTGSRFLHLANIKLKSDQRPEDLYQRREQLAHKGQWHNLSWCYSRGR